MKQTGRVFSLLRPSEVEDGVDLDVMDFRINELIAALKEGGYRIDGFAGDKTKYSILEKKEDGFDEVGIVDSDVVFTRDSENLERFLENYEV